MKTSSLSRIALGILVTTIGLGFLLNSLNVFNFLPFIATYWPLIIVGFGAIMLFNTPRSYGWAGILIAAGTLLQLNQLDLFEVNFWSLFWPGIIIITGLSLIFNRLTPQPKAAPNERVSVLAVFGGTDSKNNSKNFRGGSLSAFMGGITLDLRDATIKDAAEIEAIAFMGGVEIRVPETWNVQVDGLPLMGGWENKVKTPASAKAPTLYVKATCVMGAIEVKN